MLVLERATGQKIFLLLGDGREIIVRLLAVDGNQARVGVQAPRSVQVVRGELLPDWQASRGPCPPPPQHEHDNGPPAGGPARRQQRRRY